MNLGGTAVTRTVEHAEFDAAGLRLGGTPGFLTGGPGAPERYLGAFATLDGEPASPPVLARTATAWRRPGASIDAELPDGGWRLLTSHDTAAGGLVLMAVDRSEIRARNRLAHQITDRHPMPIWVNEVRDGGIVFLNDRARALFEVPHGEEGSVDIREIFPNTEENRHVIHELRDRGRIENYSIRAQSRSGREFRLRSASSLFTHEGTELALTVVQDVSSAEESASELARSRDLLNDALRTLNEGFALFDEDGRLIVCNDRYRSINAAISEFITPGVYWEMLLREMARRHVARHAAGREAAWVDEVMRATDAFETFEIERSDGTSTTLSVHPTTLGGFIVAEADITARRAAEQSARDSELMLSKILEASPANLCMSRIGDGEVIYRSPASAELFGSDTSARDQFADPADRADFLTELLPTGRAEDFPATARRANGETFPALFSARIIDYRGEDVMVSTVTDLTERVEAERTIRDAGHRLRDAIEALAEGFILYDADERVVMANARFLEMNAPYADRIVPGTHTRDLLKAGIETGHMVDGPGWLKDYEDELARGEGGSQRAYEFQLADGSWINSVRRPTRDGGFVITWLDVTEQKQAAAELTRLHDRLRDAIESLDEGFALYDHDDRLIAWNRRYEELNSKIRHVIREGATYAQITETAITTHDLPPEEAEKVRESARRDRGNHRRRFEFRHHDGRWYSVSRNPTSEDGFVITRLDITERKRAEEAEREADETVRRVLEACPVNLVMCRHADGELTYVSNNTAQIFGRRANIADYWVDAEAGRRLSQEIDPEGGLDQRIFELKRADDSAVKVALSSRRIDFRGEPMVVSHAFDLTERIAMEAELSRQQEMLHQSEKLSALGELLAGVAHELNNPLSVVVGHSLMMQEETTDPALLQRTEKISAAAERCSRIVKTFLAMARQRPARLERVAINTVIDTALDVAGYGLRSAGARVDRALAPDLPPVMADPDQLAQVFANLIVNAEHALQDTGEDARLTLTTRLSDDARAVVIEVADNGPGIPEAIRARIFEPFFTTKSVGEGTGIGLAFCHRIIDTHGGTITVANRPDGGACFTITLDAARPAETTATPDTATPAARGRALVIDDEADVADLVAQILRRDGYEVVTVASAEIGLSRLPGDFDLILTDLNMPGMGGQAFLEAVQRAHPGLDRRIAFVTGDTMSPAAQTFLAATGRPHLEKPVTPADLRRLAAALMAQAEGDTT